MRLKRLLFSVSILATAVGLVAGNAAAQAKIAVLDFQQALLNTADMQKQAAALEAKFKPRQDEIQKLSQELQDIQAKMQSASAQEGAGLQAEGQRKQLDVQRLSEDLQADVDFEREGILAKAAGQMRAVVNELRGQKGLDLIVDASTALSFNATLDITKDATTAYDAAHPVQ